MARVPELISLLPILPNPSPWAKQSILQSILCPSHQGDPFKSLIISLLYSKGWLPFSLRVVDQVRTKAYKASPNLISHSLNWLHFYYSYFAHSTTAKSAFELSSNMPSTLLPQSFCKCLSLCFNTLSLERDMEYLLTSFWSWAQMPCSPGSLPWLPVVKIATLSPHPPSFLLFPL